MDKVHAYFTHLPQYGQTATVILAACLTIIYSSLFQTNAGEAQFFVLLCDKYLDFQKKSNTSDKVHVEMLDQISILRNQTFQQLTDQSVSTGVAFGITFLACFLSAGGGLQLLKVEWSPGHFIRLFQMSLIVGGIITLMKLYILPLAWNSVPFYIAMGIVFGLSQFERARVPTIQHSHEASKTLDTQKEIPKK